MGRPGGLAACLLHRCMVCPALTTVRQDLVTKGRAAAAILARLIEQARSGTAEEPEQVRIATELVVRQSTGPAPAA